MKTNKKVASEIENNYKFLKDRSFSPHKTLSKNIELDELESALKSTKNGKAAGLDGVYPEFMKNLGDIAKNFIISIHNEMLDDGLN